MDYVFYFDETFHDRKIVLSPEGNLNVLRDDGIDDYIGTFWGCEQKYLREYMRQLGEFEDKYRAVLSLGDGKELKSEVIGRKNYQFGIRSFNKNAYAFYYDLFTLLSSWEYYLQINIISKTELFIRKAMQTVVLPRNANPKAFVYSLTKLLVIHKPERLIQMMKEVANGGNGELFWNELKNTLEAYAKASVGVARKAQTITAFTELSGIVSQIQFKPGFENKTDFEYFINFKGLCNLLNELNIKPQSVKISIDAEQKTFEAAQLYPFGRVKQGKSDSSIQIRLADWLGGFIGRMIYGMKHDENTQERILSDLDSIDLNDIKKKRLLSPQWFDLNDAQFAMYKLLYKTLIVQQERYWTTLTMTYCDDSISFYSLLRYFASYESFDQYDAVSPDMHTEYYNNHTVAELNEYYKEIEAEATALPY